MYRGTDRDSFVNNERVRKDRYPKDTSGEIHELIDDLMHEKFGIRGRSQTLFVTGKESNDRSYGDPYIIFPVGSFKFLWSKDVKDLYNRVEDLTLNFDEYDWTDEWEEEYGNDGAENGLWKSTITDDEYLKSDYDVRSDVIDAIIDDMGMEEGQKGYWESSITNNQYESKDFWSTKNPSLIDVMRDDLAQGELFKDNKEYTDEELEDSLTWVPENNYDRDDIDNSITWIPDMSYEDYADTRRDKEERDAKFNIKEIINDAKYQKTDLKGAIKSDSEIMIDCEYYYACSTEYLPLLQDMLKFGTIDQYDLFDSVDND